MTPRVFLISALVVADAGVWAIALLRWWGG